MNITRQELSRWLRENPELHVRNPEELEDDEPEKPPKRSQRSQNRKRPDLNNVRYRSAWEANYARYQRWLQEHGKIKSWEYEPETFYFPNQRSGVVSYTPDFRITENDGTVKWIEIKGYMDRISRAKLRKMAFYNQDITITVIGDKEYHDIAKDIAGLIPNWEYPDTDSQA